LKSPHVLLPLPLSSPSCYSPDDSRHLHPLPTRRSSDLGWSRRRLTASACIGLLPARIPPMPPVCRVRSHAAALDRPGRDRGRDRDRKSTRLNSSHEWISYAVFCLKKKREK